MEPTLIFQPVFALVLLTVLVWVYLFAKRIPWIQSANLTPEQLKPGEFERIQPDDVLNPGANFKNLFEVPVLFYVLAVYLAISSSVDTFYIVGAWLFVASRYVHSFIHCTFNNVPVRFFVYLFGCVIVFAMIIRAGTGLV